jgi:hypothetical protein
VFACRFLTRVNPPCSQSGLVSLSLVTSTATKPGSRRRREEANSIVIGMKRPCGSHFAFIRGFGPCCPLALVAKTLILES